MTFTRRLRQTTALTLIGLGCMGVAAQAATISFFQPVDSSGRVGYLGLYNRSTSAATITITAKDDTGAPAPGVTITSVIAAGGTRGFSQVPILNKVLQAQRHSRASLATDRGIGTWM